MKTLVLIPGLGSDATVWTPTIAALGDDLATVVGDTLRDDTLGAMARRILAAAPDRFMLAGVSMGGMISMEIMRIAPERVLALALVDTNARPDTEEQRARRHAVNAAMSAAEDVRSLGGASLDYLVHPSAPQSVREALIEMTVRVGAETYIRQNLAVAAREDLRPLLPGVTVPTQVIVGADDRMTPPQLSREICELVTGAELHILPNCGHLPPIEKPRETAALLRNLAARI